jgi:hypothetical protein
MITAGTTIRKEIIKAIKTVLGQVPVYSIMPPDNVLKYVLVQDLAETALDDKLAFLSEGFVSISVVEKFTGRDGDFDQVNTIADLIIQTITPTRQSTFGIVANKNIFSLRFESTAEAMFDSTPGRTALKSLRLKYYVQST